MEQKSVKGTKTEQNLLKAFAGESQARNRYTYFASVAKKEAIILVNEQNKKSSAGTISYLPAVFGCYLAQYVIINIHR